MLAYRSVLILCPLWHSEQYIRQEIESVLRQTHTNWELLFSDDGANQATMDIIHEFMEKDSRIRMMGNDTGRHVWIPEKLQREFGISATRIRLFCKCHKQRYQAFIFEHTDVWCSKIDPLSFVKPTFVRTNGNCVLSYERIHHYRLNAVLLDRNFNLRSYLVKHQIFFSSPASLPALLIHL